VLKVTSPGRLRDQAIGVRAALPPAYRAGAGVRRLSRDEEGDRRSELDVSADHVLILRNAGAGRPGMPEWGMLPIPTKLVKQGCATWCGCRMRV